MNFAQLKAKLRASIGNPSTTDVPDTNISGTGLADYVNDAYSELFDRFNHSELKPRARFTTIAGTDKYELSANIGAILHVWDRTNKIPLVRVGMNYVKRNEFDNPSPATAKPEKYAHVDDFLQLLPVPDGAYVIEFQFRAIAATLTSDVDVPNLPTPWHKGIYLLARWDYWNDAGDIPKAAAAKARYNDWITAKPAEKEEERTSDDTGVSLPTLEGGVGTRLSFDQE